MPKSKQTKSTKPTPPQTATEEAVPMQTESTPSTQRPADEPTEPVETVQSGPALAATTDIPLDTAADEPSLPESNNNPALQPSVPAEASTGKQPTPYKATKPNGLTNPQKAGLARHIMIRIADLMNFTDDQFGDESLVGMDRRLMADQLAAWLSYLPGKHWDARLPQPYRVRGRRKI